ncbi:telomere-associated RIF1 isoform X2 [Paramuricea clavata]|uniref:Telomere-associated RIF1 isoform X2 n=1 Tax=Paramuricea clavata TaxID=317549 RepID=A0A6S7FWE8_PARCT|nr:telomere-associated RIF1 isoform X2 [Paramuricea clavata]
MVNVPGGNVQPLLSCLEDGSSPPEDKTDAYLRLAEDLAKEDKQFVEEVCNFSSRLMSVLTRDMLSQRIELSQAALQAVGYCIYQDRIVSSLGEAEMSLVLQDLCNVVMRSADKNSCTRAFWGISKQHLSTNVIIEKLPVILNTVEHALQTFESTTVENEALEVIYRLISELPSEKITSTAGQWSKLVYPLLISSAHKIREKALGILELGLKQILLAQQDVVAQLLLDLKGGLLSELANLFTDKKETFVLRTWTVLVTMLGETLHKGGNFINEMLKIPEQGFKSPLPNVQNMGYSAWICLIDNFAISPAYIGSQKKIKLLMMPLLLKSGNVIHKDIERGRLQAWWHLVCAIKPDIYTTTTAFSEVCLPLLQYFFDVSNDSTTTPLAHSKDGLRELTLPVTPISRGQANTPSSSKSGRTPRRKSVVFNKEKFPEAFVKQVVLLGLEMLIEILATNTDQVRKSKRLTEHLQNPILNIVKSALHSCASYTLDDDLAVSLWSNIVNWIVLLIQNGDPKTTDDVIASLFLTANDILTYSHLSPNLVLKFLEVLTKIPLKYLIHSVAVLSSTCCQGKPLFLLTDILFRQLSAFKESYVDERFHSVFENLVDVGFEAPSGKLITVHNVWLVLEGLASTVANVEDLWRFWSKVTDSVTECVTKTSDVNQGDSLEPDFSLMISLLSFPFKQLFTGGLPVVTTKELDRDLAEFFRLFYRCASLVPAAEANTCIEELSNTLLTVVTQEKCKNVKFLDSISGFIYVMMDCVDFSAQNTRTSPSSTSRVNLTPGGKSRQAENPLGNLSGLLALSATVLSIAYRIDKDSSGSVVVAPAVTVIAGSLSKVFASLTNTQQIKFTIAALSSSVSSFISHHHWSSSNADIRSSDKKCNNTKYLLKIEKLWTDILMCLQSRYKAAFDSQFLEVMSELLECTFCHQRRQLKNQTIMFWNATFGQASHLVYPDSLRVVLQTVMEKTPLTVPGWDQSKIKPVASLDHPAMLQDSEEMTPKENIIKQDVVLANSPKRKHGGSSPGKLKGSFLHKAFSSDKTDRLSPFKNNLETGNKRKSPGSANARRKLPLPLDTSDDKDFVVIAPSPKKKRLLTEHQKEVRKAKKLESGHPALYNMLDQSQDGTQFSDWSQCSLSQSFNHHDVVMSEEKNESKGDSTESQNDGETNKLKSSVRPSIKIPLDNNNNGLDEVAMPTILYPTITKLRDHVIAIPEAQTLPGGIDVAETQTLPDGIVVNETHTLPGRIDVSETQTLPGRIDVSEAQTLPGGIDVAETQTSPGGIDVAETQTLPDGIDVSETQTLPGRIDVCDNKMLSGGSDCTDLNKELNNDDDDDEPIPSSQNTPSTKASRQKRRSRIYLTPKNTKRQFLSREKSEIFELNAGKMELDSESLVNAILLTDLAENSLTHEETNKNGSSEPTLEAKKQKSPKTSPISSRTRFRKNPTPYKTKNKPSKSVESSNKQETTEVNERDMLTDMEEFSDHQMDDTQILEQSVVQVSNKSSDSVETANKLTNEAPSSPVGNSSMKFVHSKTSATGSPLNRPCRSFSSPACSPTTGILKRNRGKSETPSPPGKTRHVSFAFPLKEEKEISFYPLDQVVNNKEVTKPSPELTNTFTSIKATPTKSSTPPLSEGRKEECVFPDLIECTTPVEQILPSLATSRFSRGLGHVVHAQNIRTVGNLSALTEDQVQKLPIRSPKVFTLRRVLRNFHENRAPKNPKVNQLRAIKEVSEEAETEDDIVNGLPELANKEITCDNTKEPTCGNNTPDLSDKELMMALATPSSSVTDSGKMLTPKRSRALVKPTTLFESDTEDLVQNKTDKLFASELSENQDVIKESETRDKLHELSENRQDIKENETSSSEKKQDYIAESTMIEEKMIEEKPPVLSNNVDNEVVPDSEAWSEHRAIETGETGFEMTVADVPDTGEPKQENLEIAKPKNQEIPVYEVPETEDGTQQMLAEDVPATDALKQESQEMVIDDVPEREIHETPVEYVPVTEKPEVKNQEIPVCDVPMAEESKQESQETVVEDMPKAPEQENQEMLIEDAPEELKTENQKIPLEEGVAVEDTINPYVQTIEDLLTLKSQQELSKLPLDLLLSCQEQLMTILSNTTTAIRLKCEPSRK